MIKERFGEVGGGLASCQVTSLCITLYLCTALFIARHLSAAESGGPDLTTFLEKCGYQSVPLKNGYKNKFYVAGKIDGMRVNCLIDTGCYDIVVDVRRATRLKSLGKRRERVNGPLGKIADEVELVAISRLELGSIVISNVQASVFDLHKDRKFTTGSYLARSARENEEDVILGSQFLFDIHAAVACGSPSLYVRGEKPDAKLAEVIDISLRMAGMVPIPITMFPAGPIVVGQIDKRDFCFILDTGAVWSQFDTTQLSKIGFYEGKPIASIKDLGANRTEISYAKIPSLKLGDFEMKGLRVGLTRLKSLRPYNALLYLLDGPPLAGLLGPEVPYRGFAYIDFSSNQLYLLSKATPDSGKN